MGRWWPDDGKLYLSTRYPPFISSSRRLQRFFNTSPDFSILSYVLVKRFAHQILPSPTVIWRTVKDPLIPLSRARKPDFGCKPTSRRMSNWRFVGKRARIYRKTQLQSSPDDHHAQTRSFGISTWMKVIHRKYVVFADDFHYLLCGETNAHGLSERNVSIEINLNAIFNP